MITTASRKRARMISRYAESLSAKEQEQLLDKLKKRALLEKSRKLKGKVKPNNITMDEILREIELVRSSSNG
jgi:DNA-directed RNA polymerase subunit K/omega